MATARFSKKQPALKNDSCRQVDGMLSYRWVIWISKINGPDLFHFQGSILKEGDYVTEKDLLEALYQGMKDLKSDMQDMKDDIQGIKTEMQDMKDDIQGIKTEMQDFTRRRDWAGRWQ